MTKQQGKCRCKKAKHVCSVKGCNNHVHFGTYVKRYLAVCGEHCADMRWLFDVEESESDRG